MFSAPTNRIRDGLAVAIIVTGALALSPGIATAAATAPSEDLGTTVCSVERTPTGPIYTERPHARYLPLPQ